MNLDRQDILTPFVLFVFIAIAVGVHVAEASNAEIKVTAAGIGSFVMDSDRTFESGDNLQRIRSNDQYTGGSAGHVLLTAPGEFQYNFKDTTNADLNNRYTQSGFASFRNGGIQYDSLYMNNNIPNVSPIECTAGNLQDIDGVSQTGTPTRQSAGAQYTGLLQAANIDTSKFMNDNNMSFGQEAEWGGAGFYTGEMGYSVEAGGDYNNTVMNYRTNARDHLFASTNSTGGATVRPELNFISFENSFVTESSNSTISNVTVVNLT